MKLENVLSNIEGLDERFTKLIIQYVNNYVSMSTDKKTVLNNLIQQIKKNVKGVVYKPLSGNSGCASAIGTEITLDDNLEDWNLDNTFLHEFTHQISKNEYTIDGYQVSQPNFGLKVGLDDEVLLSLGVKLSSWEIDGNNYAYDRGIYTLDEWITEWLANKMSGFVNVEVKEDANGFFRKKTCHAYDGSNVMNLLELVYGSENVANLITGFDLNEEERKGVIPVKEFHKLNELIDSSSILSQEEIGIFKNFPQSYMKTPNITGLLVYYVSEYQNQEKEEDYNVILQKMMNVLTRAYNKKFNKKIVNCDSSEALRRLYTELSIIQNSMLWHEDNEVLKSLETFNSFDKMRSQLIEKANSFGINNEEFASLYLTPAQLLDKFKLEEEQVEKMYKSNNVTALS